MPECLVIIPTYNEKENIANIIQAVFNLSGNFHVLIIDDDSPDGTAAIVKDVQAENKERLFMIERKGKLGLGTAYLTGFNWALEHGYDFIFEMDADFSHNPDDLLRLHAAAKNGEGDLIVGSRYVTGVNVVNWPMSRVLLSYFASVYVRFVTGMPVQDATAGFICYKREVLEFINLNKIKFVGYAFQIEMKFTTWKHGFKIKELPVIFTDRTMGESKMSKGIFKEAIFGIITLKFRSFFRKWAHYKAA